MPPSTSNQPEWTSSRRRSTTCRELCAYWATDFDRFPVQDRLNAFNQVTTEVDGQRVRAFHQRSPRPNATPLLLVHGWPRSVIEFIDVIGPLSDPDEHGASGASRP